MKKIIIISLFFLCGMAVKSQIYTPVNPTEYGHNANRTRNIFALGIPEKDGLFTNTNDTTAQLFYNKQDSALWMWSQALGFVRIGNGGVSSGGSGGRGLDSIRLDPTDSLHYQEWFQGIAFDEFPTLLKNLQGGGCMRVIDSAGKVWIYNDCASGGNENLQETFDIETGEAHLNKDDTINIAGNRLIIAGTNGQFVSNISSSGIGTTISNSSNSVVIGQQDNILFGSSVNSQLLLTSNSAVLQSLFGISTVTKFKATRDTAYIQSDFGDLLRGIGADGSIDFPRYGAGTFDFGDQTYILAVNSAGKMREVLSSVLNVNIGNSDLTLTGTRNLDLGGNLFSINNGSDLWMQMSPATGEANYTAQGSGGQGGLYITSQVGFHGISFASTDGSTVVSIAENVESNSIVHSAASHIFNGNVFINDGSIGSAVNGYVFTLTDDVSGQGTWMPVAGGGFETITGDLVNNSDPLNPIIGLSGSHTLISNSDIDVNAAAFRFTTPTYTSGLFRVDPTMVQLGDWDGTVNNTNTVINDAAGTITSHAFYNLTNARDSIAHYVSDGIDTVSIVENVANNDIIFRATSSIFLHDVYVNGDLNVSGEIIRYRTIKREFTGSTALTITLPEPFTPFSVDVYKNGIQLSSTQYTESWPMDIILTSRLVSDEIDIRYNY